MYLLIIVVVVVVGFFVFRNARQVQSPGDQSENQKEMLTTDRLTELIEKRSDDLFVLDVRTPGEYFSGAIPGAINIPLDEISADTLPTDDKSAKIVVYCLSGGRSSQAKRILERMGFTDVTNFGGIGNWHGSIERPKQ